MTDQAAHQLLVPLVAQILREEGGDVQAFDRKARWVVSSVQQQPARNGAPAATEGVMALRRWMAERNLAEILAVLHSIRQSLSLQEVPSSVPLAAAVATFSLIWENGYRTDHVIVPSAGSDRSALKLGELARQLPTTISQLIQNLGETGLDEVRNNDAYYMDAPKFEELMSVLDAYVATQPEDSQPAYQQMLQRIRAMMQIMTEEDLRSR